MSQSQKRTSKFLSLILRHQPELIGLELDEYGWANIDELLAKSRADGRSISRQELERVVAESDKQRFAISDDGTMIRANQGHSIQVNLELVASAPPEQLFHGTVAKSVSSIRETGLEKRKRHHVHLSPDKATATKVGSRRGKPVILVVQSGRMHQDGHEFYLSKNGVWLTDHVPAEYIQFPA